MEGVFSVSSKTKQKSQEKAVGGGFEPPRGR